MKVENLLKNATYHSMDYYTDQINMVEITSLSYNNILVYNHVAQHDFY